MSSMESSSEAMLTYDSVTTEIGRLWVALSPRGLRRIEFDMPEKQFLARLRASYVEEPTRDPVGIDGVRAQLTEYVSGQRQCFDLPLDLVGVTPFQRRALTACAAIPYGQTLSYATLARRLGRPHAARAVGTAMAKNPIALVIPCHRVVRSDGSLGGYGGGLPLKERLLLMEAERAKGIGLL